MYRPTPRHAVVIGGSMAGLLAARVLSETYEHVTVLDRDTWTRADQPRGGVPQGGHSHGLLARGLLALEQLLPGIGGEAVAAGAVADDLLARGRWHFEGRQLAQAPSGVLGLVLSRPLLERLVRDRVQLHPRVELRARETVRELVGGRFGPVTGVLVQDAAGTHVLNADLVVDATGRTSRAPRWLERLGYAAPADERVRIDVGYATRTFRRSDDDLDGDVLMGFGPHAGQVRGGFLNALEGDRWILTLVGFHGERPPLDPTGFAGWADSLHPRLGAVVRRCEPLDDGLRYRFPADARRRYERLSRFPDGFVVVGDALCTFNPIYGQGMTVAALEALALRDVLADGSADVGRRFFAASTELLNGPWQMVTGGDLSLPGTQGRHPLGMRLIGAYVRRVQRVAADDPAVAIALLRVANLLEPPQSLLVPSVAGRVLRRRPARHDPAPAVSPGQPPVPQPVP